MRLFHFSEEPGIALFRPQAMPGHPEQPPRVWAIDAEHAPHYCLLQRLTATGVELRLTPSLWPLHDALIGSSVPFSMIRLRNATPRTT